MKKITLSYVALAVVSLVVFPTRVLAFGGCVDSPEDPTLALGLLGLTASAVVYWKARLGRK